MQIMREQAKSICNWIWHRILAYFTRTHLCAQIASEKYSGCFDSRMMYVYITLYIIAMNWRKAVFSIAFVTRSKTLAHRIMKYLI